MSVFVFKIIAVITMLIDHVADGFLGDPMWMRTIGRIAFLCYAFLMAEGFRHIRSSDKRISSHLSKLVVLAFVSEIGYDLLDFGLAFSQYGSSQNNIITLLLAFLGMLAIEKWKDKPLTVGITCALTAFLNYVCGSNYRFAGVLLVYAFYWYLNLVMQPDETPNDNGSLFRLNGEGKPAFGYLKRLGILCGIMLVYIPVYHIARCRFVLDASLIESFIHYLPWYVMHFAAAALLAFYDGRVGLKSRGFNTFYSWFYPAHLLILGLIRVAVRG